MGDSQTIARCRCWFAGCAIRGLVALVCISVFSGCSNMRTFMREAGEKNKTMPAKVMREYHCDKRQLPFFKIEESQLLPEKLLPGDQLSHRIVYVMCPVRPTEVVPGTLDTRILFRGKAVFKEVIKHELKPGRWVVDSFIPLPAEAEPGVYALEVEFRSEYEDLKERSDFIVKAK